MKTPDNFKYQSRREPNQNDLALEQINFPNEELREFTLWFINNFGENQEFDKKRFTKELEKYLITVLEKEDESVFEKENINDTLLHCLEPFIEYLLQFYNHDIKKYNTIFQAILEVTSSYDRSTTIN